MLLSGARRLASAVGILLTLAGLALLAACTSSATAPSLPAGITIFAASSLTEPFTALAADFEADHPGTKVTLNFGASSSLLNQVTQGAPADVLAVADETTMTKAVGLAVTAGQPVVFAENTLAIVVKAGNPQRIASVADLARPGLVVVIATPETPIGAYTQQVLAKAQTTVHPASLEPNVKAVAAKVIIGEADAGIVYESDVKAAGRRVEGVTIPADQNVVARYPMTVLAGTSNRAAAEAFLAAVTSPAGRQRLVDAGFAAAS